MSAPLPTEKLALPVVAAHALPECPEERRWLIEDLWAEEAVGIVGGEPKCFKSFLALDIAVSVAAGTACLRRYPVSQPGRVLLFAAEDPLHVVRSRLAGIARSAGVELSSLDIQVITAPTVRLDVAADRARLLDTVAALSPRLLILDPFVRLHRVDENVSAEVAPLLGFLRDLQRAHHTAVMVVHHAKKGAAKARDGQALRGSSEFHAWGDSNLYLRRRGDELLLAVEHRAAPSVTGLALSLRDDGGAVALELTNGSKDGLPTSKLALPVAIPVLSQRVRDLLAEADRPLTHDEIRAACRVRSATLGRVLSDLLQEGAIVRLANGYRQALAPTPATP